MNRNPLLEDLISQRVRALTTRDVELVEQLSLLAKFYFIAGICGMQNVLQDHT